MKNNSFKFPIVLLIVGLYIASGVMLLVDIELMLTPALGLLVVNFIITIMVIVAYNKAIKYKNKVQEGLSLIDVHLKMRFDLVPNLVKTVKGYAKHEKDTLTAVMDCRNSALKATNIKDKAQSESQLTESIKSLFALAENYPDLKANTNFLELQQELTSIEQDIANSRKYYNSVVKMLNNKVEMFPSNVIARWFKFTRKDMFEVTSSAERENVKVQF